MMPEIDILMAAYNGEKFIAEQIESILAQTYQDFRLVIRDDGSSDNTPAIIEEYAAKYPGKIEVVHDNAECHSPTKNFFQLLTYAKADYVMFSDQDDVWLPYKVQITLDYMKKAEDENPGKPVLVFTGLEVVDKDLKHKRYMYVNLPEKCCKFQEFLLGNRAAGCTQMMNKLVCQEVCEHYSELFNNVGAHDYWTSLYAGAFGTIQHVNQVTILYRQHGGNVIGAGRSQFARNMQYLINFSAAKNKALAQWYGHYRFITFLRNMYADRLPADKLRMIDEHLKLYSPSRITRLITFWKLRYANQFNYSQGGGIIAIIKFMMKLLIA